MDTSFDTDTLSGDKVAMEVTGGFDGLEGRQKSSRSAWRSVAWKGFARSVELKQAISGYTNGENMLVLGDVFRV